jgi:hypothetical protein
MRSKEALLRNFFSNVEVALRGRKPAATLQRWEGEERTLQEELAAAQRRVHEALCDNINTQVGVGVWGAGRYWSRRLSPVGWAAGGRGRAAACLGPPGPLLCCRQDSSAPPPDGTHATPLWPPLPSHPPARRHAHTHLTPPHLRAPPPGCHVRRV